jgi:peptidase inhibitor family I36
MLRFVMKSVLAALLAVLAIGLAPSVGQATAAPATDAAAAPRTNCPRGQLCVYKDTNFNGRQHFFTYSFADYRKLNWWFPNSHTNVLIDGMDNDASSVHNNTGATVRLYQDVGYQGRVICMGPFSSVHRLGIFTFDTIPFNRTMDNRLSAHSFTRREPCDFTVKRGEHK